MLLNPKELEVKFEGCTLGVSARRIYEHMTMGQINPFGRSVSSARSLLDAPELIDLASFDSLEWFSLTGPTLAGLGEEVHSNKVFGDHLRGARRGAAQRAVRAFVAELEAAVKEPFHGLGFKSHTNFCPNSVSSRLSPRYCEGRPSPLRRRRSPPLRPANLPSRLPH